MASNSNNTKEAVDGSGKFEKISVIINMSAGSSSDISDDIRAVFEHRNFPSPTVHLVEPEQLREVFAAVKTDGTDLLVVYGGDGTCKAGAVTASESDIVFVALPGGTMNMLPKALYGTDDWRLALDLALSQDKPRWQAAGNANGKIFFCGAIVGDPILMSDARESLRDGEVLDAVKRIPDIMTAISHGAAFEFTVDGEVFDRDANGLQIYCPYMTVGATSPNRFELASVPQLSMSEVIGIGAIALTQDWRDSVHVKTALARHINIAGQGAFDVLLDGEPERLICPVNITLEQQCVLVLAPNLQTKAS